jgi:hypothetical protein
MPRHSSFQMYGDRDTKLLVSGYVDKNSASGKPPKVVTERVENVMGSCAGAGSSEFHLYLNARKRETTRMQEIEERERREEESKAFQEKILLNKKIADERTQKNALKRKRKKTKAAAKKAVKNNSSAAGAATEQEFGENESECSSSEREDGGN